MRYTHQCIAVILVVLCIPTFQRETCPTAPFPGCFQVFNAARAGTVLDSLGLTLRIHRSVPHLIMQGADAMTECERDCSYANGTNATNGG